MDRIVIGGCKNGSEWHVGDSFWIAIGDDGSDSENGSGFLISTTISMISIAINLSLTFQVLHRKCHKDLIYIAVTLAAVKPTLGPGIQESPLSYLCQM